MIDDFMQALVELFDGDVFTMGLVAALLCVSAVAFLVYKLRQARADVTRRVADNAPAMDAQLVAAPRTSSVAKFLYRLSIKLEPVEGGERKVLRHRLIQAGLDLPGATTWYIGGRIAAVPVLALVTYVVYPLIFVDATQQSIALACAGACVLAYLGPSFALDKRIAKLREQHRDGFPDFMDLMVVCCQAGLSMEAAITRVGRELVVAYPSLSRNVLLAATELRNGKSVGMAIESFAKRLGIEEAGSFSTLLQQSEELGSSLTQSLRAYSDDMRNKRLMKAEEKAHALPAKLVIPLTLFVFPVIMVVIMLPVVIGVSAVWT